MNVKPEAHQTRIAYAKKFSWNEAGIQDDSICQEFDAFELSLKSASLNLNCISSVFIDKQSNFFPYMPTRPIPTEGKFIRKTCKVSLLSRQSAPFYKFRVFVGSVFSLVGSSLDTQESVSRWATLCLELDGWMTTERCKRIPERM